MGILVGENLSEVGIGSPDSPTFVPGRLNTTEQIRDALFRLPAILNWYAKRSEQVLSAQPPPITQAGHGFVVLDPVGHNGSIWVKATTGTYPALGLVTEVTTDTFRMVLTGKHEFLAHGMSAGRYYLTATGTLSTTIIPGGPNQPICTVISDAEIVVHPGELV